MKNKYLILALITIIWGCSQNDNTSDAFGNFEADPVIISSEASGKILNFSLQQGMEIQQGMTVATIDTIQIILKKKQLLAQKAAVESKRINVKSQVAIFNEQIKNLQINESRIRKMLNEGAATQKQLDDITGQINVVKKQIGSTKTQLTSITREVEVLKTQMTALDDQLQRCFITNPVMGTILETFAEEGEITTMGKPLYKIANINELTLKVYVSGAMLPNIKLGQIVQVFIDKNETENEKLEGRIIWISPEAEFTPKIIQTKEERVKLVYAIKVNVKNDGRLKIGMPGEVIFEK